MSFYIYFLFVCNRLHLIKSCLWCFLDIHLFSNNLSTKATISSLIKSELFPAWFFCSISFNLSQVLSGSDDKKIVFGTPEAETTIPGDLSNFIRVRSRVDLLPVAFTSNYVSFAKSFIIF